MTASRGTPTSRKPSRRAEALRPIADAEIPGGCTAREVTSRSQPSHGAKTSRRPSRGVSHRRHPPRQLARTSVTAPISSLQPLRDGVTCARLRAGESPEIERHQPTPSEPVQKSANTGVRINQS
jgi:hypothetical protein